MENEPPVFHEKTLFHVGISGGKDSTAVLLWMLHESGIPNIKDRLNASMADTKNENAFTYAHIELLSQTVHPIEILEPERGFVDLAMHKKRFPSTKTRFCTQFLKIYPSQDHVRKLEKMGFEVIAVSGVRADESEERKDLPEWDYSGTLLCRSWRPLIRWTIKDVLAIHERYNVPLNPLYALGAQRVGCWPCIMSRKSEIRIIALKFPERIDEIREQEQRFERELGRYSSFFPSKTVPPRFRSKPYIVNGVQHMSPVFKIRKGEKVQVGEEPTMVATIDDVVRWSMTGSRAKGSYEEEPKEEVLSCNSGFCE